MRFALGLDVDGSLSTATIVDLDAPADQPHELPVSKVIFAGSNEPVIDAARDALDEAARRWGTRPVAVTISHPVDWDAARITGLRHGLERAFVEPFTLVDGAVVAAIGADAVRPVPVGGVVAVVSLREGGADISVLRKDGPIEFRSIGTSIFVEGVADSTIHSAMLTLVGERVPGGIPEPDAADDVLAAALARLDGSIGEARHRLRTEETTFVGVRLPLRATVVRIDRSDLQDAEAAAVADSAPALVEAIRGALPDSTDAAEILIRGDADPATLMAELLSNHLDIAVFVAVDERWASLGRAIAARPALSAQAPANESAPSSTATTVSTFVMPPRKRPARKPSERKNSGGRIVSARKGSRETPAEQRRTFMARSIAARSIAAKSIVAKPSESAQSPLATPLTLRAKRSAPTAISAGTAPARAPAWISHRPVSPLAPASRAVPPSKVGSVVPGPVIAGAHLGPGIPRRGISGSQEAPRRKPVTLLQLWPIAAAAAVLVAVGGAATVGALELSPTGSDHGSFVGTSDSPGTTEGTDSSSDGSSGAASAATQPGADPVGGAAVGDSAGTKSDSSPKSKAKAVARGAASDSASSAESSPSDSAYSSGGATGASPTDVSPAPTPTDQSPTPTPSGTDPSTSPSGSDSPTPDPVPSVIDPIVGTIPTP